MDEYNPANDNVAIRRYLYSVGQDFIQAGSQREAKLEKADSGSNFESDSIRIKFLIRHKNRDLSRGIIVSADEDEEPPTNVTPEHLSKVISKILEPLDRSGRGYVVTPVYQEKSLKSILDSL